MRARFTAFLIVLLGALRGGSLVAQQCPAGRTALVLSGGGAKGLVHIGVLYTLDSLGIRPDLIVGTSMGAIVGAMYASGYSAREIDSLVARLPLAGVIRPNEPRRPPEFGDLRPLVLWEQGPHGFSLSNAVVRESEANAMLNTLLLRGDLLARGRFDSMPIAFRVVATRLSDRTPVVLDRGDLAKAVRASFAIPLVFSPQAIDGDLLVDGGLSDNIPVDVARAWGATRIIVSDATSGLGRDVDPMSPLSLGTHLIDFLFTQTLPALDSDDVFIRTPLPGINALDFGRPAMRRMIAAGRASARAALAAARCEPSMRAAARPATLPTVVGALRVAGSDSAEAAAMWHRLALPRAGSDSLDASRLGRALLALGRSERYTAVWLTPSGRGDTVDFTVDAPRAPRRRAGVGLLYDNDVGGRLWLGMVDRRSPRYDVPMWGAITLGTLQQGVIAGAQQNFDVLGRRLSPTVRLSAENRFVRLYDVTGDQIDELRTRQAAAFVGVSRRLWGGWSVAVGGDARLWDAPAGDGTLLGASMQLLMRAENGDRRVSVDAVDGAAFRRLEVAAHGSGALGRMRARPWVHYGWGARLPLQELFTLGADEGFAGMHLGEGLAEREASAGLTLTWPLGGILLARIDGMAGNSGPGPGALPGGAWQSGIRAGLGADSPIGAVRAEYGWNSRGRGAAFVRIGEMF